MNITKQLWAEYRFALFILTVLSFTLTTTLAGSNPALAQADLFGLGALPSTQPSIQPAGTEAQDDEGSTTMMPRLSLPSKNQLADAGDYSLDESMDYTFADKWAVELERHSGDTLASLVANLCSRLDTEREKARAIYRWIGANIEYDVVLYDEIKKGGGRNRSALETFTLGRAVCGGYANLFKAMAEAAGLEAVYLSGPSLTFDGVVGHAWNAVKIEGKWRLLDATWAAGYVDDNKQAQADSKVSASGKSFFVRRFTDIYFLTPADHFIYTHFPENPAWQLLENPIPKETFMAYAKPSVHFFVQGFDLQSLSHQEGRVEAAEKIEFRVSGPAEAEVAAALKKGDQVIADRIFCRNLNNGDHTVTAWFPAPGQYDIIIYSQNPSAGFAEFKDILQYRVRATDGIALDQVQSQAKVVPTPAFQELGLDPAFMSHDSVRIWAQGRIALEFQGPEGLMVIGQVKPLDSEGNAGEEIKGASFAQGNGGAYTVHLGFPQEGDYQVNIFGKSVHDSGDFRFLLAYTAVSQSAPDWTGNPFPSAYSIFMEKNCLLNSPIKGRLSSGEAEEFSAKVPGAEAVAVNVNGKWHMLEDLGGGDFSGEVTPRTGQILLYGRFPGMTDFSGLVAWECGE